MTFKNLFIFLSLTIVAFGCTSRPMYIVEEASPVPKPYPIPPPKPSRNVKIVIDAGHGGKDSGALSLKEPKSQEKQLTLETSLLLNTYLKGMGYQTILTRADDYFIPLELRSAFANSNQASLFVSVHYNAAENTKAEGVEVFFYQSETNKQRSGKSKQLAENVLNRILAGVNAKSRGVKHGNLAVIRETKMPAILVEGGFVTNDKELKNLKNPQYIKKLAQSIALGINDYVESVGDLK